MTTRLTSIEVLASALTVHIKVHPLYQCLWITSGLGGIELGIHLIVQIDFQDVVELNQHPHLCKLQDTQVFNSNYRMVTIA